VPVRWGSPSICRSAVIRRHGSAGRFRAGPVCSIAGSLIVRLLAVNRQVGSAGRYQAGTVCLIAEGRLILLQYTVTSVVERRHV
jgi:hypothetical protein